VGWRLVAWVNAGDPVTLAAGLAAAAEAAGLAGPGGERCLLVFDNAADPDVLRPGGRLLVRTG